MSGNSSVTAPTEELKTISASEPDFIKYLDGSFSKTHRALPIQNLNVGTPSELVTFKIVENKDINTPPFLNKWISSLKVNYLLQVLFPIFVILSKLVIDGEPIDVAAALLSTLGVCSIMLGANCLNEYLDHMSGGDRISTDRDVKPILNGWTTAIQMRKLSVRFLILGVLCGLPAIMMTPELLFGFVFVSFLLVILFFRSQSTKPKTTFDNRPFTGAKSKIFGELIAFFFLGPFLTYGFQMAASGSWDLEGIFIGVIFGLIAAFLIQIRNLELIIINEQIGFVNTVSKLGFEKAKKLIFVWWLVILGAYFSYHLFYTPSKWSAINILPVFLSIPFLKFTKSINSTAGSEMTAFVRIGKNTVFIVYCFWLISSACYWFFLEPKV